MTKSSFKHVSYSFFVFPACDPCTNRSFHLRLDTMIVMKGRTNEYLLCCTTLRHRCRSIFYRIRSIHGNMLFLFYSPAYLTRVLEHVCRRLYFLINSLFALELMVLHQVNGLDQSKSFNYSMLSLDSRNFHHAVLPYTRMPKDAT